MAGSPELKVYDAQGNYQAACKEVPAAALLMSLYGDGSTIRWGHAKSGILWTEGVDGQAAESYDGTGEIMQSRLSPYNQLVY